MNKIRMHMHIAAYFFHTELTKSMHRRAKAHLLLCVGR
uniref:Uncharacterized protein n=1 Tax=Octopus bimaculoides TaxID=37653 RepID=A0A0L8GV59_OCTBM